MRSEQTWSLLDPKPVLLYLDKSDDYIVYWNGIVMPHSFALCMAMETFGIYSTPEMKGSLESNYKRLYYSGAFNTRSWDHTVETQNLYNYLKRIMKDHLAKVLKDKKPSDILSWFDYQRARKETV